MGKIVEINVAIILIIEVIAGILAVLGIYQLVVNDNSTLGFYAAILSAITLLLLLFGQRVAKDYDGARTIVIYLIPTLFALYLMQ